MVCDAIYVDINPRLRTRQVADAASSVGDEMVTMPSRPIYESINAYIYTSRIDLVGLVERIKMLGSTKVL
jgi:hypothetical protein